MSRNPASSDDGPVTSSDGFKRIGPTPAGEMVTLHAGAEQTDGRYDFMVTTVEPGPGVIPLHIHHEHDEAIYVLDGKLEVRVGDEWTTLTPESFVMMPSGVAHTWRNAAEEPSRFICLFSPGDHVGVLEELADLEVSEEDLDLEAFEPILKEYDIEMVGPPPRED